jgi:hypothetical protein
VKHNASRPALFVATNGRGVVNHAGARLLCDLADRLGLSEALSRAMAGTRKRRGGHDRGRQLVDLAVTLADGGTTISDLETLRDQPALFGAVASVPTAWRTLDAIGTGELRAIARARAEARARAWAAGADPGWYVLDFDATLVDAHSEKDGATPTYKRGFGFHPLLVYLDATREPLAGMLREGRAGSNTAKDHVRLLDEALAQLPVDPARKQVVARADAAGYSHRFLAHCRKRRVRFIVGHPLTEEIRAALFEVPASRWQPALAADGGEEREGAEVCEITDLVERSGWPEGARLIARREYPHDGAQMSFTDIEGRRYQLAMTDLPDRNVPFLEAMYRGRARVEQRIRAAKETGLEHLPSARFAINRAWLALVLMAQELLAWAQLLLLEGELADASPKRLRYCLLHAAAVVSRTGRRTWLRLAGSWRWSEALAAAFARLRALPLH